MEGRDKANYSLLFRPNTPDKEAADARARATFERVYRRERAGESLNIPQEWAVAP